MTREREHLAQAERHLTEGRARVASRDGRLARLRAAGVGPTGVHVARAEEPPGDLERPLALAEEHYRLIMDEAASSRNTMTGLQAAPASRSTLPWSRPRTGPRTSTS